MNFPSPTVGERKDIYGSLNNIFDKQYHNLKSRPVFYEKYK